MVNPDIGENTQNQQSYREENTQQQKAEQSQDEKNIENKNKSIELLSNSFKKTIDFLKGLDARAYAGYESTFFIIGNALNRLCTPLNNHLIFPALNAMPYYALD